MPQILIRSKQINYQKCSGFFCYNSKMFLFEKTVQKKIQLLVMSVEF